MRLHRTCVFLAVAATAAVLSYEVIFASNSSKFDAYVKVAPNMGPPHSITTIDPVHIPLTGRTYVDPIGFFGDVREERQFLPCNEGHPPCVDYLLPQVLAFASAHPGHLYVLGDEYPAHCSYYAVSQNPCTLYISAQMYAEWFHQFTCAVLSVDPTARFAPAGIWVLDTATAEAFYNYYLGKWGAPPVSEWRFHLGEISHAYNAATWSVAHGAPMAWVVGPFDPSAPLASGYLDSLLSFANNDSRIVQVTYYGYDLPAGSQHNLVDLAGNLTPNGIVYKSYALGSPSLAGNSIGQLGDFNNDGCDDFANHDTSSGIFAINLSLCNGTFGPNGWSHGQTAVGPDYDVLVGDFTGDGWADYADIHVPTGQVFVKASVNGIFPNVVWGYADMNDGADWELVAADINGDGRTDIVERQLSTGLLFASLNKPTGGTPFVDTANKKYLGRSKNGPDWRVVFGDFNGDGLADFADQHTTSGTFWIHPNTGAPGFHMDNVPRGVASPSAGGSWRTVIGDFNGDGYADYMDLWTDTGAFWLHNNLQNGTFVPPGSNSGTGSAQASPTLRILGSR